MTDRPASRLPDTALVHYARRLPDDGGRPVNPALVRSSTYLFDDVATMNATYRRHRHERVLSYGANGNPTAFALEDLISELEGGYRTRLLPTGLAAIAQVFVACLQPGDHVLISDACYAPVRRLAVQFLQRYGIEHEFFAAEGGDLAGRLRPNTRMVYAECPGSLVYELCDLPAIAALTRPRGIVLAVDNTWGAGGLYRPLALGADVSVIAATKYLGGHSDVMLGAICTNESAWPALQDAADAFGASASPDDAWLVLRGCRSLAARLRAHEQSGLAIARWLQRQRAVRRVFHPALPEHAGHHLWRRDFAGSHGLLSIELRDTDNAGAARFVDALQLFGIGASWGGFESLAIVCDLPRSRSISDWSAAGPIVRLHIGLEAVDDLQADLERAFAAL